MGAINWALFVFTLITFSMSPPPFQPALRETCQNENGFKPFQQYATNTNTFSFTGIFLHKHRVAHGATGFGMPQQRADVEKGANVTEQPVELQYVQQPQFATA